jgi:paraquat-inducible protein B
LEVKVFFKENQGLKEGSPMKHKGIEVGRITHLNFTENMQLVVGTVYVDRNAAPLFRAGTLLWVEQAEVSFSGIKNADSILFGSYLNVLPGNGPPVHSFTALTQPPYKEIADSEGLGIVLEAKHLGSLSVGSPIYYRRVQVGQVTGYELSPTFQKVHIFVSISRQYSPIIRKNTRFWNVSGAQIEGGIFSGLTISTASLEAVIRGGIALATPDNEKTEFAVESGHHFSLYDKPEKHWLDWNPDITLLESEKARKLPVEN